MTASGDVIKFKAKFPAIKAEEADIGMALMMTDDFMDSTVWPSKTDFANARLYLAAHYLSLQQQQRIKIMGTTAPADMALSEAQFGERRVSFQQRLGMAKLMEGAAPGEAMLNLTIYGQAYIQLRARNIFGIVVV